MRNLTPFVILLFLGATGCGYFMAGTWEDDPDNFRRAWGISPPEEIRVIHSWYRRSPHFTLEEMYYFEIDGPMAFAEAFAQANDMAAAEPSVLEDYSFCSERPAWFAPGPPSRYSVWISERPTALALHEKTSNRSFIYACQL